MNNSKNTDALVILLHGVGSNGQNMLALAEAWRDMLPGAVFSAPDAPKAFDQGAGRQWFAYRSYRAERRGVAAARSDFDWNSAARSSSTALQPSCRVAWCGFTGSMSSLRVNWALSGCSWRGLGGPARRMSLTRWLHPPSSGPRGADTSCRHSSLSGSRGAAAPSCR